MDRDRLVTRSAMAAAVASLVITPIHALARFQTADGKSDLDLPGVRAWAEPAAERLRPLLDWGSADTVYTTWGKLYLPLFLVATACAFLVRRSRPTPYGAEKWGWRIALSGYVLTTVAVAGEYWTPLLEEFFAVAGIPGLLISLIGSIVLGIGLLRRGYRPRVTPVLLLAWFPLMLVLSDLIALGAAFVPWLFAWALAGRALDAESAVVSPRPSTARDGLSPSAVAAHDR